MDCKRGESAQSRRGGLSNRIFAIAPQPIRSTSCSVCPVRFGCKSAIFCPFREDSASYYQYFHQQGQPQFDYISNRYDQYSGMLLHAETFSDLENNGHKPCDELDTYRVLSACPVKYLLLSGLLSALSSLSPAL